MRYFSIAVPCLLDAFLQVLITQSHDDHTEELKIGFEGNPDVAKINFEMSVENGIFWRPSEAENLGSVHYNWC